MRDLRCESGMSGLKLKRDIYSHDDNSLTDHKRLSDLPVVVEIRRHPLPELDANCVLWYSVELTLASRYHLPKDERRSFRRRNQHSGSDCHVPLGLLLLPSIRPSLRCTQPFPPTGGKRVLCGSTMAEC
jgi:hypothetical protein